MYVLSVLVLCCRLSQYTNVLEMAYLQASWFGKDLLEFRNFITVSPENRTIRPPCVSTGRANSVIFALVNVVTNG